MTHLCEINVDAYIVFLGPRYRCEETGCVFLVSEELERNLYFSLASY